MTSKPTDKTRYVVKSIEDRTANLIDFHSAVDAGYVLQSGRSKILTKKVDIPMCTRYKGFAVLKRFCDWRLFVLDTFLKTQLSATTSYWQA